MSDSLPTYEEQKQFPNELQVKRAGAMVSRASLVQKTTQETPTLPQFVLVVETQHSDRPPLHLRVEGEELQRLVELVSPCLGPSRQAYRRILAALAELRR